MATKLERLLSSIDPKTTLDEISTRVDSAINTFPLDTSSIDRWDPFRACLIRFLHHLDIHLLRLPYAVPMGVDFDWGRCCQVLLKAYGSEGEKTAFELARTGNEGGLYSVLKKMATAMAEQYSKNEIAAKISFIWNSMSAEEKIAAGWEYVEKYGHLLPSELTEGSAARIRANLPKALEEHPKLIQRLRQVGRT
jgi:hypothetical protein